MITVDQNPEDAAFGQNPYPTYRRWRRLAPAVYWQQYQMHCFSRYAEVNAILRDKRFGRQILHLYTREQLGWEPPAQHLGDFYQIERNSLLELEPPQHSRLRRLLSKAFVSRQVASLAPRIETIAQQLLADLPQDGSSFDLLAHYANVLPVRVIAWQLGVPDDNSAQLLRWSHAMVAMYQARRDRALELAANQAAIEFSAYVRGLLRAPRADQGEHLLAQLIRLAHNSTDKLNEDELLSTVILLLNAGHEATVHSLGNAVKCLLEQYGDHAASAFQAQPEQQLEEALRFDPPLHMFTRYALAEFEFAGVQLKPGSEVGLLLAAANRDPRVFTDPDSYRADRSTNPHLSFGAGIHFCVGAPLARLELLCALRALWQRFPRLRLAQPAQYQNSYHFHGLQQLMVYSPQ